MVVDAEVKRNKEDHSSERTEKYAQKGFDRADIVRDFRLADDLPGTNGVLVLECSLYLLAYPK